MIGEIFLLAPRLVAKAAICSMAVILMLFSIVFSFIICDCGFCVGPLIYGVMGPSLI